MGGFFLCVLSLRSFFFVYLLLLLLVVVLIVLLLLLFVIMRSPCVSKSMRRIVAKARRKQLLFKKRRLVYLEKYQKSVQRQESLLSRMAQSHQQLHPLIRCLHGFSDTIASDRECIFTTCFCSAGIHVIRVPTTPLLPPIPWSL